METLGPALERLYMTRASAYRDALKSFIEGYEEGIQQQQRWIPLPIGFDTGVMDFGTLVLSHRTQILYIADISFLIMYLEVVPGCLVLEFGTGSGSLTTLFASAVVPTGYVYTFDFHEQRPASARIVMKYVYTFDFHEQRPASAREDFERIGISTLVTMGVRDIQGEGFPDQFSGLADYVFLDLPQPWLAIPSEIYGPLKYCSACMKSVNGKWITRRSMMGIPVHALHARGGRLQVKQVWGTMQVLRQSWLGHLLKLEGILDI
ncbi:hypothetical protein GOBAR_AA33240 [Gossypium barbadense]|uniref:tRNA (adenine(58)-N(1))-methyltransferase n=1 Tax=Gossypium barbadense TaxID=3634 RepID=A0A2P5W8P9_GOSBA|nr:hypothetical protein GOBAR_AA33240 [Gossypium barbadense]